MKKNFYTCLAVALIFLAVVIISGSCRKLALPVVTTSEVSGITNSSATGGGTIVDEGSSSIVTIGLCWSTDPEPSFQDFRSTEMAGVVGFTSTMKGLLSGRKYYVRAYAVNDEGIGYGNEVTFTTL